MDDHEPGTFRASDDLSPEPEPVISSGSEKRSLVYIEATNSSLGRTALFYTETFGTPKKVLYPGSGGHVIDRIFPDSEITYVDPSEQHIFEMSSRVRDNLAVCAKIEKFSPDAQFDLLFSLNSHAPMDEQLKRLKRGGHVFCNNYFGTKDAEEVIQSGTSELMAVAIDRGDAAELEFMTDNLAPYLEFDPEKAKEKFGDAPRKKIASYYIFRKLS